MIKSTINKQRIFQILSEIKSEPKLIKIFEATQNEFDVNFLSILIDCAFKSMIAKFKHDCFQHNPHMNYLKLSPVLKQTINVMSTKLDDILAKSNRDGAECGAATLNREMIETMTAICNLLRWIMQLQHECMIYVEVSCVNKFINENFFAKLNVQLLVEFSFVLLSFIDDIHSNDSYTTVDSLSIACDCLTQIIRTQFTFNESNNFFRSADESHAFFSRLLRLLYDIVEHNLACESFLERNQLKSILKENDQRFEIDMDSRLSYAKAIFLGAFIENSFDETNSIPSCLNKSHLNTFIETIRSLIIVTMRSDSFYFFAVTPREIINSFEWQHSATSNHPITFQSVSIDCLNEIDIVEKFLKRYQSNCTA